MFRDSKQINQQQMATLRGFLKQYRGYLKSWKLLYRASEHGFSADSFHERCDNQGPTLTIASNTINRTFGGFTKQNWRHNDKYLNDYEAFLFSLDKNQKYMNKNTGKEIHAYNGLGPTFGCGFLIDPDLLITNNSNQNNGSCCYPTRYKIPGGYANLTGEQQFTVKEVEVY